MKEQTISQDLLGKLAHCTDLPSPSGIATRIIELCQRPDTSVADVTKVIHLDPALSSKMMRVANSPLYARKRKILNLRQAIALFGLNGTLTLALAFSLVIKVKNSGSQQGGLQHDRYWRRCLASAVCSQILGEHLGIPDREELFLAGLLQDIGMLALEKVSPGIYQQLDDHCPNHSQIRRIEMETLGTDHAAIGAWLLNLWNFPEFLVNNVAASHGETQPVHDRKHDKCHKIVYVASAFADLWWQNDPGEALDLATRLAEKHLSLTKNIIIPILNDSTRLTNEMAELFDITPCDENLARIIMENAREIMSLRNIHTLQQSVELRKTAESLIVRTQELEEENRRDNLTGLYNRYYLEEKLAEEYKVAKDNNFPLTVIFLDLDHFKSINDTHGHHVGDEILKHCAKIFMSHTRGSDFVARYGGEEFVAVLPGTDQSGAETVCARILESIRTRMYRTSDNINISLTASVGIATLGDGQDFETPEGMIRSADRALYLAKTSGRNQSAIYR